MVSKELMGKKFDALKFVMADKLPSDLWNRSPKKVGLVVVATKVDSVPKDIVIPVDVNPAQFIKDLSQKEGITPDKVDVLIKQLREDKALKEIKEGEQLKNG